ncbi:glycosyltransferase family 2 protein [Patescibacteria group bacterium]|nr:glycosyltransferase family 2 protein [Patescibacteria group bacterium]
MKIIAIIPAYNEGPRVAASVRDVIRFVDGVVVVDDCSLDDTARAAQAAGAFVVIHPLNRGQGAALQTGMDFAIEALGADAIVHFDADGQMQGEDVAALVAPLLAREADVVLGSRFLGKEAQNMPLTRRLTLKLATLFTRLTSGIRITDTHNGFRAFNKQACTEVRITLDRMAHASEILDLIAARKLRFCERPVTIFYSADSLKKGSSFFGGFKILKDLAKKSVIG